MTCRYEDDVSKITGMLLELQMPEIHDLIDNDDRLRDRVNEALKLLREKNEQI